MKIQFVAVIVLTLAGCAAGRPLTQAELDGLNALGESLGGVSDGYGRSASQYPVRCSTNPRTGQVECPR